MKNFDTFDLDLRPSLRRSSGGLSGMADRLACRKFGIGSPESSQATQTLQEQTTAQGGGSGSGTVVVGAGGSTGAVTVQSVDPAVVQSAFQFGSESQTIAAQTVGQSNSTIEQIAAELANLTANATPQTPAAAAENLATIAQPNSTTKIVAGATVLAAIVAALAYVNRKGRPA